MSAFLSPAPHPPLRIARVLTRPAIGGAALHVALLVKHLKAPEYPTLLLAGRTEAREGNFYAERGAGLQKPTLVPSLRREPAPARDLRALRDLVHHFRTFQPHIVDTHLSKAGILGRMAAKIARVPATVHTFHVNIFDGYEWEPVQREIYLRLERAAAFQTDCLICLSDDLGLEMQELGIGKREQWQTIHLGLELEGFDGTAAQRQQAARNLRAQLRLPDATPLVGFIGRLAPVKNLKALLEAAPQVLKACPNAHFVLAGDGPSRERLEEQARELSLANRIHFLGMRSDIAAINWALDAVVLPSLQEGTPISLIETLAASRPVVATRVGGVPLVVQHEQTGLLVEPRDTAALAAAIVRVLAEPESAHRWALAGQVAMQREFGIERLIAHHRALYQRLWATKCAQCHAIH